MKARRLRAPLAAALCALAALATAQPTVVRDPYYGDALFHFFEDDTFGALTGLMVSQHFERVPHHADEAELLRGGLLLSYGLHREAGRVFAQLVEHGAGADVRGRAWYYLAKIRYQRGLVADAERALSRIEQPLPGALEEERALLAAQLRLVQGDNAGAAALLAPLEASPTAGLYARFNLGVALVRSGQVERGDALLDAVGRAPAATEEQRSLRDRANLALGFAALQARQAQPARAALQRVRLNGAASNKALLAYGWADDAMGQPRQALVPWTELAARDPSDAAVLEARLALPYAMAELGVDGQALQRYTAAVGEFDRERQRLDESIAAIGRGALVAALLERNPSDGLGGRLGIRELPRMPYGAHLSRLLAADDFQEAFKNLRDLQFLRRNLDDWRSKLGAFDDMLATRRQGFAQRLPALRERAGALGLPALRLRRDALAAELAGAEQSRDPAAFADARERALQARIADVRRVLQAGAGNPALADAAERLRRVEGALTWQLAQDEPARLWDAHKGLRATDRALAQAQAHDAALARAQSEEPTRFERFAARIAGLESRIEALTPRVAALDAEQQQALQALAVAALNAQKQRLDVYTAQARLAIAQLHDRALLAGRNDDDAH